MGVPAPQMGTTGAACRAYLGAFFGLTEKGGYRPDAVQSKHSFMSHAAQAVHFFMSHAVQSKHSFKQHAVQSKHSLKQHAVQSKHSFKQHAVQSKHSFVPFVRGGVGWGRGLCGGLVRHTDGNGKRGLPRLP